MVKKLLNDCCDN